MLHRSLIAAVVVLAAALSACTRDEPATVTMPERRATTTTTTTVPGPDSLAPEEDPELPPVAWVLQVGGPGDDILAAVDSESDSVLASGWTAGLVDIAPTRTEALVIGAGTDGVLSSAEILFSGSHDRATAVATAGELALTCGATGGDLGVASAGGDDLFCASVGPQGLIVDPRQLGSASDESATGVSAEADGEFAFVSGSVTGLMPGAQDPMGRGLGNGDALAAMVDSQGAAMWARQFGTPALDGALGVITTPAQDGIFVGFTEGDMEGPSAGGRDGWISRFDTEGVQRWVTQLGSAGSDELHGVATIGEARRGDELFIAGGMSDGDIDAEGPLTNEGGTDAIAAAFQTNGRISWMAQFGTEGDETVNAVVSDGSIVYLAGTTTGEMGELFEGGGIGGGTDGFVIALDGTNANVLWTGRFGTDGTEQVTGLTTTDDGMLIVSGATTGQLGETPPAGGIDGFLLAIPLVGAGGGAASSV